MASPMVGIIMGSQSDWSTMKEAANILTEFDIAYETKIVSAHRTPNRLWDYGNSAAQKGLKVIIAGAGGAAHLPGMIASLTPLPVLGVPIESKKLKGLDSLLSIAQMPKGIPVGTLAIGEDMFANAHIDGNIANLIIYNRKLNADEILQNYNAQKERFGF